MVTKLSFVNLSIPFRVQFEHNSAVRNKTQSVLIIVEGIYNTGYGEGCPREYVTNESIDTALVFFENNKRQIMLSISDLDSLLLFRTENKETIKKNPACWCAIEMAFLDLFAKEKQVSIERLLGCKELEGPFQYTAVIGGGKMEYFTAIAQRHFQMNFLEYKIKISGNVDEDYPKIKYLKEHNPNFRIRLDANNLWENQAEVIQYCKNLPYPIVGLEEPLKNKNISALANIYEEIGIPIIMDESFLYLDDIEDVYAYTDSFILNVRVSKMGGIINCLQIAKRIKELKIPSIVGAQVGESSLLTRAALLIRQELSEFCIGMEGAYGTLLLEDDITNKSIIFGDGGNLNVYNQLDIDKHGLQLSVEKEKINKYS
jgi:L-alanine-DL-glutamate epimerase-like enolase superfamily enzyme